MSTPSRLAKYWDDPDEVARHPGPVIGRRPSDGMPVLGDPGRVPDMIGEQADDLPTAAHFRARMFRMWDGAEAKEYAAVMDHVVNGQYTVIARREILAEAAETGLKGQEMKIWLEWGQMYVLADAGRRPGGGQR